MKESQITGEEDPSGTSKFNLRMPREVRERIEEAKRKSGRSLNGELVARIQMSLDTEQPELIATIRQLHGTVEQLKVTVDGLSKRLDKL